MTIVERITKEYRIVCDVCGDEADLEASNMREAMNAEAPESWSKQTAPKGRNKFVVKTLCPRCTDGD